MLSVQGVGANASLAWSDLSAFRDSVDNASESLADFDVQNNALSLVSGDVSE